MKRDEIESPKNEEDNNEEVYGGEESDNIGDDELVDNDVSLDISEAYLSIQGEGIYVGMPSLFIRTTECNLKCIWCDTKGLKANPKWTPEAIDGLIQKHAMFDIVITGGEPMVRADVVSFIALLSLRYKAAIGSNSNITIETNGTISPQQVGMELDMMNSIIWSVSPKMRSAGQSWKKVQFKDFLTLPRVQWKFPIDPYSREDLSDFETIMLFLPEESLTIIAQPVAAPDADVEKYAQATQKLIEYMKKNHPRVRVIPQLHKFIFGMTSKSI